MKHRHFTGRLETSKNGMYAQEDTAAGSAMPGTYFKKYDLIPGACATKPGC